MPNKYWDEDVEAKGESLYETREGRVFCNLLFYQIFF